MPQPFRLAQVRLSRAGKMVLPAVLCAAAVSMVGVARAGIYHVYGCRTPLGAPAPTDGWSGSISANYLFDVNSCATGGSMDGFLDGSVGHVTNQSFATWTYSPPPQASIVSAMLWRATTVLTSGPNVTGVAWIAAPHFSYDSADVVDSCVGTSCSGSGNASSPLDPGNRIVIDASHFTQAGAQIVAVASCGGADGWVCPAITNQPEAPSVDERIFASDVTLQDESVPTIGVVSGPLTTDAPLAGTENVIFNAADTGPGLYSVVFTVDGHTAATNYVGTNDGKCVDVGGTTDGTHAFLYGQPCPPVASVDDGFDTTQFPDGVHHVVVTVTDASGNSAVVLDRTATFHNSIVTVSASNPPAPTPTTPTPPAPAATTPTPTLPAPPVPLRGAANGTDASDTARLHVRWIGARGNALTSRWGRSRRIAGRLVAPDGTPITHAAVEVLVSPAYAGARTTLHGNVVTDASGRFRTALPGRSGSCAVRFRYYSHAGDKDAAASGFLKLTVPASLLLSISPRVTRVGRHIRFTGRLRGSPIPTAGKLLILEARSPGGSWIEFQVVRTNNTGRYHATYQFRLPGPATYQFRVLSRYEAAFPFVEGTSNVVSVRER